MYVNDVAQAGVPKGRFAYDPRSEEMMKTKESRFVYDPMTEDILAREPSRFAYDPRSEEIFAKGARSPMSGHPPLPDTLWEASSPVEGDEEGLELF